MANKVTVVLILRGPLSVYIGAVLLFAARGDFFKELRVHSLGVPVSNGFLADATQSIVLGAWNAFLAASQQD